MPDSPQTASQSTAALHLFTRAGEVIAVVDERLFVTAARGPADANGNPWRALGELDAKGERTFSPIIFADHAAVPVSRHVRKNPPVPRENHDTEAAKYAEVQHLKNGGSELSYAQLCALFGCNYGSFMKWRRDRGFAKPNIRTLRAIA